MDRCYPGKPLPIPDNTSSHFSSFSKRNRSHLTGSVPKASNAETAERGRSEGIDTALQLASEAADLAIPPGQFP